MDNNKHIWKLEQFIVYWWTIINIFENLNSLLFIFFIHISCGLYCVQYTEQVGFKENGKCNYNIILVDLVLKDLVLKFLKENATLIIYLSSEERPCTIIPGGECNLNISECECSTQFPINLRTRCSQGTV